MPVVGGVHVPGDGCDQGLCGWGNGEEQWYLPDNVSVGDGVLRIEAKRQRHGDVNTHQGNYRRKGCSRKSTVASRRA